MNFSFTADNKEEDTSMSKILPTSNQQKQLLFTENSFTMENNKVIEINDDELASCIIVE